VTPRDLGAFVAALALVVGPLAASVGATPVGAQRVADRDCSDFATQAAAQRFYVDHGGPRSDPHRLDADGDGVACESNPCPCSTATGGGGDGGGDGPARDPRRTERAKVVEVVDGDTVDVRLRSTGRTVRVRVVGVDTPEVYGGRECWGPQASAATTRTLPVGTRVVLTSEPRQGNKDRYGRLLRYVTKRSNSLDVGRWLVHHGHATVLVVGDGFERVRRYRAEQRSANRADRGLWGACRR